MAASEIDYLEISIVDRVRPIEDVFGRLQSMKSLRSTGRHRHCGTFTDI